jgi:hypothetical protein
VPADRAREELGFLEEFLDVVFAKVCVQVRGRLVEGEDVICGFELRDGDEADLVCVGGRSMCCGRVVMLTFLLLLLAAFMREVMAVRFSVSCFARWGFICMSSAIVVAGALCREGRSSRRQFGDVSGNSVSVADPSAIDMKSYKPCSIWTVEQ